MSSKINTLFAAIVIAGMSVNANAQSNEYYNTRHEFGIAVGSGATSEIVSGIADFTTIGLEAAISTAITGGLGTAYYTYGDESYIPTISAEYFYHVNKYVGLGGFVAFNGVSRDMYFTWKDNVNNSTHKELSGSTLMLVSYATPVAELDLSTGWLHINGLYSMTTRRHIGWFMRELGNFTYQLAKQLYEDNKEFNIRTGEVRDL